MGERIGTVVRDGLTFDVRDQGPIDGEPVVLLHGFPQDARSWDGVAANLHEAGYRAIAPDQRGYSPRARPRRRRDYRLFHLADDVDALIAQLGAGPVHLVGHDWGAAVAWVLAARRPSAVRTLTAVSVPHPAAFLRSMVTSTQLLKSWYMLAFQLPWIPERLLSVPAVSNAVLRKTGQLPFAAARDVERMGDRPAVRGGLNWYRALPLTDPRSSLGRVEVPTLMVWSDADVAIGRAAVDANPRYVAAPYRLETLGGVSHWIPDEAPDKLADLILAHIAQDRSL
ncbi:pimeloyl-ACP methyl ester carboxylesterase [Rhodococcus sp. SMB37]|uniref:alpha/beta fold hydrolase n=1 Tax=Rhodococcus sp. SMB37 TaxID=2512213 RepID=UPI00104683BF|nr:alpha/beta fold hydrolase [Rhodococcus sp. SMB37]TCN49005.1 pimeloyl-ACP methyl ester carboxylesterase [Rhodococcus sp. SMB37]